MIGFGLIGCGRIAARHIATLAKCEGARLVALCDVNQERMEAAEADYRSITGEPSAIALYRAVDDLLDDQRVDVIVIAAHSAVHAELAKKGMAKGKHIILEKPMSLSLAEANEIVRLAAAKQLCVQVCHQLRYRPLMTQLKQLVEEGALGHVHLCVVSIRLQRSEAYYEAAPWRGTWAQDGGMLLNQGIHLIDLALWFMGEYENVYGSMSKGAIPKETEDAAAGIVRFKNGGIGVIEANTITQPNNLENSIALFGEKGTVCIGGSGLQEIRRWSVGQAVEPNLAASDEHLSMYEEMIRALRKETGSMVITAAEGKKALELIFALYQSVRSGKAADESMIANFTTLDMEGWT